VRLGLEIRWISNFSRLKRNGLSAAGRNEMFLEKKNNQQRRFLPLENAPEFVCFLLRLLLDVPAVS
jgi:hypothetical protein